MKLYVFKRILANFKEKQNYFILIFIAFIILGGIELSCELQQKYIDKYMKDIRKDIGGSVLLEKKGGQVGKIPGENVISEESIDKLSKLSKVEKIELLAYSLAFLKEKPGFHLDVGTDFDFLKQDSNGNVLLITMTDMQKYWAFKENKYKLTEGNYIASTGNCEAVISRQLAQNNSLQVGSTIHVSQVNHFESAVKVTVTGIMEVESMGIYPSWQDAANLIFVNDSTMEQLNGEKRYREARLYIEDPLEIDKLISQIKNSGIQEKNTIAIVKEVSKFKEIEYTLNNTQKSAGLTNLVVLFMDIVILSLLVMYFFADRLKELGILMSLGERRFTIFLQLFFELFIEMLPAVFIAWLINIAIYKIRGIMGYTADMDFFLSTIYCLLKVMSYNTIIIVFSLFLFGIVHSKKRIMDFISK